VLRLPQAEQDALHVLAVATEPASAEELGAVVVRSRGQAPLDLNVRLHRLVESHLLTVHPSRGEDRFAFAREADRERLVGALQPKDLVGLHLGWGHELRRRKAEPERVARHLMTADPAGEGWLAACEAATVLASRLAHDDAVDLLLKAVPHAPLDQRGGLHQRLAEWHRALADYPGALKHAGLWRKHLPADQKRLARAESARLLVLMGRLSTAEKVLRRVLGDAPAPVGTDAASARAFTDFAELRFLRGAYPEALGHAERGAAALQGQPELLLGLRNTVGKVHLAQGAYEQAHQAFAENHAAAKELGLGREAAQALLNQGVVAHRRGDKRAAIALYRAALPDLDRKGQAHALSNLGSLYAESGDFEPAVEHLSRALLAFSRARRNKEIAHCSGNLARLSLFLGDLGRAEELSEHMAVVAGQVGDPYLQASAGLIAAELAEARSQHPVALDGYRRARAGFEHLQSPRYAAEAALGAARSALLLGERAEARLALVSDALDQLAPKVASLGAERELVLGDLALLVGDLSEATRRLSRAKEILLAEPDLEGPYRVYALLSRLRLQAGDAVGAQAELGRATRLLEELVSRVPLQRRADFLKLPRRAQVLAASAEREITPARVQRALDLGQEPRAEATAAIVGNCEPVQRVLRQLGPVSRSQATVLIRGESGTGKELIAEAIHLGSQRRDLPLIKVNCAALPEELLMSELFGHEKGAFTGAVRERKGRFELAEGGTIFLDEIGDISPKAQVALLRVLQEREFERVGGSKTIKVDVRVVCATHRDLEAMIARGTFRQDLYYRLKGVMLALPSLRERMEDLPLLVEHLLAKVAAERKEPVKSLSPEAFELVRRYDWPGNIRELENVLSSASLFAPGRLIALESFEHLPELRTLARTAAPQPVVVAAAPAVLLASAAPAAATQVGAAAASGPLDYFELARQRNLSLKDLRHEVETQCISRALQEAKGNISEAARLLKMKRSRLSQIVNAESVLRSQVKGEASPDAGDGLADEMEGD
jgi:DNA-binding NtrC family response regulator/tetratricopeptide (TPR) repeat protein